MRTLTFLTFYSLICSWLVAIVTCFWLWLRSMHKSFHMFLLRDWYSHEIQCSFPCSCIGKDKIYAFHGGWINFQNRNFIVSSFHKVFQIYQICVFLFFLTDGFFFRFPILRVSHFGFHRDGTHCPETVAVYKYDILCEIYNKSSIQPQFQTLSVIHCDPKLTVFTFGNAGKLTSS